MKKKRLLAWLLTLAMVISLLPMSAFAADEGETDFAIIEAESDEAAIDLDEALPEEVVQLDAAAEGEEDPPADPAEYAGYFVVSFEVYDDEAKQVALIRNPEKVGFTAEDTGKTIAEKLLGAGNVGISDTGYMQSFTIDGVEYSPAALELDYGSWLVYKNNSQDSVGPGDYKPADGDVYRFVLTTYDPITYAMPDFVNDMSALYWTVAETTDSTEDAYALIQSENPAQEDIDAMTRSLTVAEGEHYVMIDQRTVQVDSTGYNYNYFPTLSVDKAKAAAGETVTINVIAPESIILAEGTLKVNGEAPVKVSPEEYTFVMPNAHVAITAEFTVGDSGKLWTAAFYDDEDGTSPIALEPAFDKDTYEYSLETYDYIVEENNGAVYFNGTFDGTATANWQYYMVYGGYGFYSEGAEVTSGETMELSQAEILYPDMTNGKKHRLVISAAGGTTLPYYFTTTMIPTLDSLSINDEEVEFNPEDATINYEIEIARGTNTAKIEAIPFDDYTYYVYLDNGAEDIASEPTEVPIKIGVNTFKLTVDDSGGVRNTYTLNITVKPEPVELKDGIYELPELAAGPSSMFNHFEADSRYLIVDGDSATIRFITDASTASIQKYAWIALGKSSELVTEDYQAELPEGTTIIKGVLQTSDDGLKRYLFDVTLPTADVEALLNDTSLQDIYITVYNDEKPGWYKAKDNIYLSLGMLGDKVDLAITNTTNMFKAVSAYKKVTDGKTYAVVALSGTGYHELFKGTYEQAVANGDKTENWIHGYENAEGKWEFQVPIEEGESYIPIVSVSDSYYTKYLDGQNSLERAFYPRQFEVDLEAMTLTTGDYERSQTIAVTNNVKMFKVKDTALLETVGGPNSNNYKCNFILEMDSDSFDKAFVGTKEEAAAATETIAIGEDLKVEFPVKWEAEAGKPETLTGLIGKEFVMSFFSVKNQAWYERVFQIDEEAGTLVINSEFLADYTAVDAALAKVPANLLIYTEETLAPLTAAIEAVDRNKLTSEQAEVDAMAADIEAAIAGLVEKPISFKVTVNGKEITAIKKSDKDYDASYEDWYEDADGNWYSAGKVESHIPLYIVTVPAGTTEAEITLNDYVNEYQTYYYTAEPDASGYSQYIDFGIGDKIDDYTYLAVPDKAYSAQVNPENVIRVQSAYVQATDGTWVSHNLYAIGFNYAQSITVKASAKSVGYATLAKGAKSYSLLKVSGNKGTLSYKKTSGSKYITVNSKTGKVTIKKKTPAGKYTAKIKVTAAAKGSYVAGSKTVTVTITVNKAKQPMTAKAKAKVKNISYSKLSKKNQTITRKNAITVKSAQGKVTYKKTSGNKKITVNSKTGKITIKKGLKKGTYKITVQIKAAGNKNYKAGTKKVTFKIKVK